MPGVIISLDKNRTKLTVVYKRRNEPGRYAISVMRKAIVNAAMIKPNETIVIAKLPTEYVRELLTKDVNDSVIDELIEKIIDYKIYEL